MSHVCDSNRTETQSKTVDGKTVWVDVKKCSVCGSVQSSTTR